jgi:hypothetical protein
MKGLTEIGNDVKSTVKGKHGPIIAVIAIIIIIIILFILISFFMRMYYFQSAYAIYIVTAKGATKADFKTYLTTSQSYKGDWNPMNYWNDVNALCKYINSTGKDTILSKATK